MTERTRPPWDADVRPTADVSALHASRTVGPPADAEVDAAAEHSARVADQAEVTEAVVAASGPTQPAAQAAVPTIARRLARADASADSTAAAASAGSGRTAVLTMARAADGARAASAGRIRPPDPDVDPPEPDRPHPVLPRGRIGPVHVGQLLCVQMAVLVVFAVVGYGPTTAATLAAAVGCAALIIVLTTMIPIRGRAAAQWLLLAIRFTLRQMGPPDDPIHDSPAYLPSVLVPGSVIGTLELDNEQRIGILEHPDGVTVLFAPAPAPGGADGPDEVGTGPRATDAERSPSVLSPVALLRALPATAPPASVQLLTLTTAPSGEDDRSARTYRELQPSRPTYRGTWLALTLQRTVSHWSDDDLAQTLGALLRGVQRRLAKSGERLVVVDPDDFAAVFAAVLRLPQLEPVVERWRAWELPDESHVSYQVVRWGGRDGDDPATLLDSLAMLPGASTVLSLAVRRAEAEPSVPGQDHGELEIEGTLRVCAQPGEPLKYACAAAVSAADDLGAQLRRYDGMQRAGAVATTPFGGFSR
ncbi:MAG: type VII secretion protein EccE [Dermatophilaceae bacterium]